MNFSKAAITVCQSYVQCSTDRKCGQILIKLSMQGYFRNISGSFFFFLITQNLCP